MKLFRGENNKLKSFDVHEGNNNVLSEHGPGKYFFNFKNRSLAIVYALEKSEDMFELSVANTDNDYRHDKGYFYECSIKQDESRTLDKVSVSEIMDIEALIEDVMDNTFYDYNFLERYEGNDTDKKYITYMQYLSSLDNVYELINEIHTSMKPTCNQAFCMSLDRVLTELKSFMAIPPDGNGEIIVYNPSKVSINNVIEVTKKDLLMTKEERINLTSSNNISI